MRATQIFSSLQALRGEPLREVPGGDYDESKPPHPLFQNLNKQKKVDEYTYGDALPL